MLIDFLQKFYILTCFLMPQVCLCQLKMGLLFRHKCSYFYPKKNLKTLDNFTFSYSLLCIHMTNQKWNKKRFSCHIHFNMQMNGKKCNKNSNNKSTALSSNGIRSSAFESVNQPTTTSTLVYERWDMLLNVSCINEASDGRLATGKLLKRSEFQKGKSFL